VFAFAIGAFMYYLVFYRARLVPRWLSGWGLAGVLLMLTACLLALFSNSMVTGYVLLAAPIGVQEFVFAFWLLIKGLSSSSVPSATLPDSPATTPTTGELAAPLSTQAPR
jgi:Domain of unknown function (DUF4386)